LHPLHRPPQRAQASQRAATQAGQWLRAWGWEEALLAEVEAIKTCRGCDRRVDAEWIICPWCRQRLKRVCPNCDRLVGLDWSLCAWCGKDFERPATERAPEAATFQAPAHAPIVAPVGDVVPRTAAIATPGKSFLGR